MDHQLGWLGVRRRWRRRPDRGAPHRPRWTSARSPPTPSRGVRPSGARTAPAAVRPHLHPASRSSTQSIARPHLSQSATLSFNNVHRRPHITYDSGTLTRHYKSQTLPQPDALIAPAPLVWWLLGRDWASAAPSRGVAASHGGLANRTKNNISIHDNIINDRKTVRSRLLEAPSGSLC